MRCSTAKRIVIATIISLSTINIINGHSKQSAAVENQILQRVLPNGQIRERGVSNLFSKLALRFDIPIGIEVAANDDLTTWYEVEFKGERLADFLLRFASEHRQYSWEIQDGVINIFPTTDHDPVIAKLVQAKIHDFSIAANTDSFVFANNLMETPEVSAIMASNHLKPAGLNFSGLYFPQLGRNFTRRFENGTVKSILNNVVRESFTAKAWTIKRLTDQRLFIRVDANAEGEKETSKAP